MVEQVLPSDRDTFEQTARPARTDAVPGSPRFGHRPLRREAHEERPVVKAANAVERLFGKLDRIERTRLDQHGKLGDRPARIALLHGTSPLYFMPIKACSDFQDLDDRLAHFLDSLTLLR